MTAFPEVKHRHGDPVSSLDYAHVNNSYVCYNMMSEKHPSTSYPAAKHPKHNQLKVSRFQKKQ